jgi:hypothetical protein
MLWIRVEMKNIKKRKKCPSTNMLKYYNITTHKKGETHDNNVPKTQIICFNFILNF